jgi:hypothetical protein
MLHIIPGPCAPAMGEIHYLYMTARVSGLRTSGQPLNTHVALQVDASGRFSLGSLLHRPTTRVSPVALVYS